MNTYSVLNKQIYTQGNYSLVPLRMEDRYDIMRWRNEQIYHLRQSSPLTQADQDRYFNEVVSQLFIQEYPGQILFSYLEGERCIGYGGLVHINWVDKHAELSFIIDTSLEKTYFEKHWSIYLGLIERVAFQELEFNKIFTYAFDLRPYLYPILEKNGFKEEARLMEHCLFDSVFRDVIIHSKLNNIIKLRLAEEGDLALTYCWASNPVIRKYSLSKHTILADEHESWFLSKIADMNVFFFIATILDKPIGSIRFDGVNQKVVTISYLIDPDYHGKGFGKRLLSKGLSDLYRRLSKVTVTGLVLQNNIASKTIFEKLGFCATQESEGLLRFTKQL